MKEINLKIDCHIRAEHLQDISWYNENYYKIESSGDSCGVHYPYNIIREVCHEDEDYYEYTLGYFSEGEFGEKFVEVFSWSSDYGDDSIFRGL